MVPCLEIRWGALPRKVFVNGTGISVEPRLGPLLIVLLSSRISLAPADIHISSYSHRRHHRRHHDCNRTITTPSYATNRNGFSTFLHYFLLFRYRDKKKKKTTDSVLLKLRKWKTFQSIVKGQWQGYFSCPKKIPLWAFRKKMGFCAFHRLQFFYTMDLSKVLPVFQSVKFRTIVSISYEIWCLGKWMPRCNTRTQQVCESQSELGCHPTLPRGFPMVS